MENPVTREIQILMAVMNCGGFNNLEGMKELENAKQKYYQLSQINSEEDLFDTVIFEQQQKINDMKIKKLSGKNETNNAEKCPKCKSDRYYVDEQRKAGDEPRNFEIRCPTCNLVQLM